MNNPNTEQSKEEQESATPSAVADPTPTSFEGWLEEGKESTNKVAVLHRMYSVLFPDRDVPAYSYIGKTVKRVGSPGRLCQLLWEAAAKRPVGDVLAYILATYKGGATAARHAVPDDGLAPDTRAALAAAFERITVHA